MTNVPRNPGQPASARLLLKDRAYDELKELIQTEVFPPDTFLSERQLVERLGMSKTPIRSALEHLEARGLVVVAPQQGIVVKSLSAREILDLFDIRAAIEPFLAARLSDRVLPPESRRRLEENLALQSQAASSGDALAATRLDVAFHLLLAELSENREALAWLALGFDKLHRSILRINRAAPDRLSESYRDHAAIAGAILASDRIAAPRLMTEHLGYGRRFLLGG